MDIRQFDLQTADGMRRMRYHLATMLDLETVEGRRRMYHDFFRSEFLRHLPEGADLEIYITSPEGAAYSFLAGPNQHVVCGNFSKAARRDPENPDSPLYDAPGVRLVDSAELLQTMHELSMFGALNGGTVDSAWEVILYERSSDSYKELNSAEPETNSLLNRLLAIAAGPSPA